MERKREIIITAPSLDLWENVSGVSAVVRFIIENNRDKSYVHFRIGKKDSDTGGVVGGVFRFAGVLLRWARLVESNKNAVIHYSYPLNAKSIVRDFFLMGYAMARHRKMLIHVHGGLYLTRDDCPWLVRRILNMVFSWQCLKIALSDKEKDLLTRKYNAKNVAVLPNCVPLDDAADHDMKIQGKDKLHLLYIGRIEKNKGIDVIIKACAELKRRGFPFVLHIAGKEQNAGEYLPKMQEELGDNFVYEGVVSGKGKTDLFKRCNVFLLPSFYEGLPMSLLESMSFGIIPICTNVGSIVTVVDDGVNGFIVPQKDYGAIVKDVEYLFANCDKTEAMSAKAKRKIFDNFSPKKYIERLNALYYEVM